MRRLTTKQKFAVVFSAYLFILLMVFCVIFFVIYQFLIKQQINSALYQSKDEVLSSYIQIEDGQLKLRLNSEGITLKEYFLSKSLSAVILDKDNNIYKSYGVLALMDGDNETWPRFTDMVMKNSIRKDIKPLEYPLPVGKVTMLTIPVMDGKEKLGILVVGKSWDEFDQAKSTIILATGFLGLFGLMGSFLLGYLLAGYAFKPIEKIIAAIEDVDLEKLDKTIRIKGSPPEEIVHLSRTINGMLVRIRTMVQEQKDFLSHASHELRRPMTKAVSALDIIALKRDAPVEKIIKVRDDLMEVNTLLSDLLSLGQRQKPGFVQEDCDLLSVIKEVILKSQLEINQKNIRIEFYGDKNASVKIPASYLFLMINNLISNAVKYSYEGTTINVTVNSIKPVILEIEDRGIGINQEEIKKIFNRFYRSQGAREFTSGDGLGLSLVKQVCDLYQTRISISSKPEKGTKVTLQFVS